MFDFYMFLKWTHIISVIIALGSNITHFFWILAANNDPINRANILRLVKKIDDLMAVPCYVLAGAAGIAMWLMAWPTTESWIVVSLVLFVISSIWGITFDKPVKNWIRMARWPDKYGSTLENHGQTLTRRWFGIVSIAFIILLLMVFKPNFW